MKLRSIFTFILFFMSPYSYSAIYNSGSEVFNLVMNDARMVQGITFDHVGNFVVEDTNDVWMGTGPDNQKYKVSTLKYSFDGTIYLDMDDDYYNKMGNCEIIDPSAQFFIGWTLMQPGISGIVTNAQGALYFSGKGSGVGVQTRWRGFPLGRPDFVATFSEPSLYAYVFVTDGPEGMYQRPGDGKLVYVHGAGQAPNAIPYSDMYGLSCGDTAVVAVGESIPTDPIEPPIPDTVCNFDFDDNILDLGTVDQTSAAYASVSTNLNGYCNADASVDLEILPSTMEMGGLTIEMMFDNDSDEKSGWDLSENRRDRTPLKAVVSDVGTVIPGSYSKSGVVRINYE